MSSDRRLFFRSMAVTLVLAATAAGLLTVDARGRALTLGDRTPTLRRVEDPSGAVRLELHAFGLEGSLEFTQIDDFLDFLLDFGCIPHR